MKLTTNTGRTILIEDKPFSSGGQGGVHHLLSSHSGMVAKVFYHETSHKLTKAKKLEARIDFMMRNSPLVNSPVSVIDALAWPKEMLYRQNHFVGFLMPEAGSPKLKEKPVKLTCLCLPDLQRDIKNKPSWSKYDRSLNDALKTRLKLCYNIAKAINTLHQAQNYVVVDLKPDNILINSNGWMSIIDLDSIQISKNARVLFPAEAFTEEYIPPEWQTKLSGSGRITKQQSWDRFSYAVLAYQLLLGIHPFTGSHLNFHSTTDFIREGLFPNGRRKGEFSMISPPHQAFSSLPQKIQQLFLCCFEDGHRNPHLRPSLREWADTIVDVLHPTPRIIRFWANTAIRKDVTPVRLNWDIENPGQIKLNGRLIQGKSFIEVRPAQDKVYTLEVKNGAKVVSKHLSVKVDRTPPLIDFFRTDKLLLSDHHPATLSWGAKRAEKINISGVGDVSGKSFCRVAPVKDTTYRLTVTDFLGQSVSKNLTVQTSRKSPVIRFFKSSITHRNDNSPVHLSWEAEGAYKVFIGGIGDVSQSKSIKVDPRKDTTYRLRATSYFGIESHAQLQITVSKDPPVIHWFKANPDFLDQPGPVQLSWKTSNASHLQLIPVGDVSGKESCTVNPLSHTWYELKAVSYFGVEAKTKLEVGTSNDPPEIKAFYTPTPLLAEGFETYLTWWVVKTARSVSISPDIGQVPIQGRIAIKPHKDCTYTITAKSGFGAVNTAKLPIRVLKQPVLAGDDIEFRTIPLIKKTGK